MKVLYVLAMYYPRIGGVEYSVKSVAERLSKRGFDVYVLAGEPDIDAPVEEKISGVAVYRWPTIAPGNAYHYPRRIKDLFNFLDKLCSDVDVVHIHSVHSVLSMKVAEYVINRNRCGKIVVTPHYHGTGHTVVRKLLWSVWRRRISRILENVDIVHSVSEIEYSLLRKDYGIESKIIPHGVEEWLKELNWEPSNYVLYAGRIEKYKNIEKLGLVVEKLNELYNCGLELKIIGDGSYRSKLVRFLNSLNIHYTIYPYKPYKEYIEYLRKARFFANMSSHEAFGITVLESLALGTPVVVSKPWGVLYRDMNRALIIDRDQPSSSIASNVFEFLKRVRGQPKDEIRTWTDVADLYISELYS